MYYTPKRLTHKKQRQKIDICSQICVILPILINFDEQSRNGLVNYLGINGHLLKI